MAEAIVSTILELLTSLAIEKASEAWSLVKGVEEEVERLKSNFEALRYELEDAEERQYVEKRVKHWLDRFKEVSYDMEDVLEDWKFAFHKLQTTGDAGVFESASTSTSSPKCWKLKVPRFFLCFSSDNSHVVSRYGIASRIKEINEQVDQIVKDREKFGLVRRELWQPPKRQDTTSFADVSKLHGRDRVKKDIIEALLDEVGTSEEVISCNKIPTIAIVGVGGLGKTALAQMVYNDPRIQTHFQHKIWIAFSGSNKDEKKFEDIGREIAKKCKDKGEEYFDCLAALSFFQNFNRSHRGRIVSCQMHDVIHDFLLFLTKSEFVEKEVKSTEDLRLDFYSKKARHIRLVIAEGIDFPISISGIERLRSLGMVMNRECNITSEALRNLFRVSRRLRLLQFGFEFGFILRRGYVTEEIPDEIGKLFHLRYLGLQKILIKKLPESICQLCNLETLDLRWCYSLETLPDGIGKLINLRYLYTRGCNSLSFYPKGIGRLTSLVGLTDITVRVDRNDTQEFSIGDFENLKLLHGHLYVELVGVGAIDKKEVERAKLHDKEHLKGLHIKNRDVDHTEKRYILQALTPLFNLEVVFGDIREEKEKKIQIALMVQKAALQCIAAADR
ncbi:Disease resistance protein [Corchorus olitorius]|uniref:Disease resistance protein n=1 Tax=Corchorus olitorius TaxID=93759 RepID=A0A1R3JMJ7_9ROSI|nr:Disease resistance protein [Corchorus olitorius]